MKNLKTELKRLLETYSPRHVDAPDRIPAAVLIPFFEKNGHPHILFTKRTEEVQHHPGEICFPGGSRDHSDLDLLATALRELQEEVNVPPDQVEILGRLDSIKTVSSYFLVVPYVGFLKPGVLFEPSKDEVQELLEVPFEHLRDPSIFSVKQWMIDQKPRDVYYYQWRDHTIWGVTARILKTLLDLFDQNSSGEIDD